MNTLKIGSYDIFYYPINKFLAVGYWYLLLEIQDYRMNIGKNKHLCYCPRKALSPLNISTFAFFFFQIKTSISIPHTHISLFILLFPKFSSFFFHLFLKLHCSPLIQNGMLHFDYRTALYIISCCCFNNFVVLGTVQFTFFEHKWYDQYSHFYLEIKSILN